MILSAVCSLSGIDASFSIWNSQRILVQSSECSQHVSFFFCMLIWYMAIVTAFFWGIYFCLFSFVPTGCYICSYLQVIWNLLPSSSWSGYATCSNPRSRRRMLFRKGWKRYSSRCPKLWFLDLLGLQDHRGTLRITWVRWQWPWANLGLSKIFYARFLMIHLCLNQLLFFFYIYVLYSYLFSFSGWQPAPADTTTTAAHINNSPVCSCTSSHTWLFLEAPCIELSVACSATGINKYAQLDHRNSVCPNMIRHISSRLRSGQLDIRNI